MDRGIDGQRSTNSGHMGEDMCVTENPSALTNTFCPIRADHTFFSKTL